MTGMTPEGGIWMVSSSFQTENCWMNLGRQEIRYRPYSWRLAAFSSYLSVGFMTGAWSLPPAGTCQWIFI